MILSFVSYSVLQTRDGLMVRPHPAVWRAIHGIVLVYMIILVSLLGDTSSTVTTLHSLL